MLQRLTKSMLTLVAVSFIFASCTKKQYSSDAALTPSYSPSIFMGSDNRVLYALNPSTGVKNWEYSFPQTIYASPLVYNDMVYIGTTNALGTFGNCDTLYKFNAKTGALMNKIVINNALTFTIMATPIAADSILYVATSNDTIYAIDTGRFSIKWSYGADGPLQSSPTIYNGHVYFASTAGTVYCVDKTLGTLIWTYSTGGGKSFTSSPSISDPYLYIGCSDSSMYCIYINNPGTTSAALKWTFKTNGPITSSPANINGRCIFGSNDFNVYCVDSMTGGKMWSFPTSSNVNSSPVISYSKDLVYIASNDYNLYALTIQYGTQKWKFATNGLIKSSPLDYKGTVYIGSYDKYMYALDGEQGTLKWSVNIDGQMECSPAIDDYSGNQYNSQVSGYSN